MAGMRSVDAKDAKENKMAGERLKEKGKVTAN
jgi:hypothetical protein